MSVIYKKLATTEKSRSIYLAIAETLLSLVIGAFLGALFTSTATSTTFWIILGVMSALYIGLLILRVITQIEFPASMVEELKSSVELDRARKNVSRKETIDSYIDATIQILNQETCSITDNGTHEVCSSDIDKGVRAVMKPVISLPNHILDVYKSEFTVGFAISCNQILPQDNSPDIEQNWQVLIPRDDINLAELFPNDVILDQKASGAKLQVRNALQHANNNNKYFESTFEYKARTYSIVTSPIAAVCEDNPARGILFIITEGTSQFATDSERVLLIFGRILSNWLSKYDGCYQCKLLKTKTPTPKTPHK